MATVKEQSAVVLARVREVNSELININKQDRRAIQDHQGSTVRNLDNVHPKKDRCQQAELHSKRDCRVKEVALSSQRTTFQGFNFQIALVCHHGKSVVGEHLVITSTICFSLVLSKRNRFCWFCLFVAFFFSFSPKTSPGC